MPTLFKKVYKENLLKEFTFFLRPTLKNCNSFIHLLDKLISENLNKKFFADDLELEEKIYHKNREFEIRKKNTLALLEEWLSLKLVYPDEKTKKEEIKR